MTDVSIEDNGVESGENGDPDTQTLTHRPSRWWVATEHVRLSVE